MMDTTTENVISQPVSSQTVQTNRERGDTSTKHSSERQNSATNEQESTVRTKDIKLSELRTKELKLKKMEEQIKQREKSAQEANNNRTKLESRCQELEATNYELEQTVKTLIRRIDSIEYIHNDEKHKQKSKIDNNIISDEEKMSDYFNHRFMRLHRKMTDLVFDKIEKQIDNILEIDSENDVKKETISNSVLKQQHQNERSDNQQSTEVNDMRHKVEPMQLMWQSLYYRQTNQPIKKATTVETKHQNYRNTVTIRKVNPPLVQNIVREPTQTVSEYEPHSFLVRHNPQRINRNQY